MARGISRAVPDKARGKADVKYLGRGAGSGGMEGGAGVVAAVVV